MDRPELPSRADVVVVGAGFAGLRVGGRLATAGVDVCVLEARPGPGLDASGRDPGLLTPGLPEPLWRTEAAVGLARLVDILDLGDRSRENAVALGAVSGAAWHLAGDRREADELARSRASLVRAGRGVRELEADELPDGFVAGYAAEGDVRFSPATWICGLLGPVLPRVRYNARVLGVRSGATLAVMVDGGPEVQCEVVVYACGYPLVWVDPWFADKLTPVREAALVVPGSGRGDAVRTQLGYSGWSARDGSAVVYGCRWATPHLEVGEDTEIPDPRVLDRLHAFARRHGLATDGAYAEARIVTHTCDGLPFVGPLPGDPRRVACTGMLGFGPALAVGCADQVADGLLVGARGTALIAPGRMAG